MNYQTYKNTRDASWCFLIEHKVNSLPLNLKKIVADMGIFVRRDNRGILNHNEMGLTVETDKEILIIVRESDIHQTRYTISHELGHITLGHLRKDFVTKDDEYSAERFAIGILAPACVLWGIGIKSAEDIAELCNISISSARKRAVRMNELYSRNKFLTSVLERKVYEQFSDFILLSVHNRNKK
ncbi:MAG: ImmA/IrrE family metallo-endopeptidase [Ruminococcus sp.]|nr:ImmA/IrrE family metallo-endopeptidase [Ruminococcus sp.]